MKRNQLVWDMIKIHVYDGPFFMGTVANYPQVIVIKSDLKNVPRKENLALGGMVNPWIHPDARPCTTLRPTSGTTRTSTPESPDD